MPKRAYIAYHPRAAKVVLTPVVWIDSARSDLKRLSDEVRYRTGFALQEVQRGRFPKEAAPLHGDLSGLIELRVSAASGAYRSVLTLKLSGTVYVLHVFQKKSPHGSEIPRRVIALIKRRLARAKALHAAPTESRTEVVR